MNLVYNRKSRSCFIICVCSIGFYFDYTDLENDKIRAYMYILQHQTQKCNFIIFFGIYVKCGNLISAFQDE